MSKPNKWMEICRFSIASDQERVVDFLETLCTLLNYTTIFSIKYLVKSKLHSLGQFEYKHVTEITLKLSTDMHSFLQL